MQFLQNILLSQFLPYLNNAYVTAGVVFILSFFVLKIFQTILIHKLKKLAQKTRTDLDDIFIEILEDIKPHFYLLVAGYFSLKYLVLSELVDKIVNGVFVFVIVYQVARSLQILTSYGLEKAVGKTDNKGAIKTIGSIAKIFIWVFAFLIILSNLGFNITSLIAGLGVGGIAVAFALQNILEDIFSSFSIFIDKPFQAGDFIIVGDDMGIVEKIGIKTTRLRTLQGEELVVSNKELTSARVRNFKKMEKRRVVFSLGIAYETSNEKMIKIPEMIKDIIEKEELAEFDRAHFKEYGDFSLNFEIVYYITSPDYNQYMDTQQSINLATKGTFEEEGIEFAYPTQKVFLSK